MLSLFWLCNKVEFVPTLNYTLQNVSSQIHIRKKYNWTGQQMQSYIGMILPSPNRLGECFFLFEEEALFCWSLILHCGTVRKNFHMDSIIFLQSTGSHSILCICHLTVILNFVLGVYSSLAGLYYWHYPSEIPSNQTDI